MELLSLILKVVPKSERCVNAYKISRGNLTEILSQILHFKISSLVSTYHLLLYCTFIFSYDKVSQAARKIPLGIVLEMTFRKYLQ